MTWFSPVSNTIEQPFSDFSSSAWAFSPSASSLGSAIAGSWTWANSQAVSAPNASYRPEPGYAKGVRLSAPPEILRRMARAALALGRSESDIWVEAAREWLLRHEPEGPIGIRPISGEHDVSATSRYARRARVWRDIDDVLDTLRYETCSAESDSVPA